MRAYRTCPTDEPSSLIYEATESFGTGPRIQDWLARSFEAAPSTARGTALPTPSLSTWSKMRACGPSRSTAANRRGSVGTDTRSVPRPIRQHKDLPFLRMHVDANMVNG
jgi:hypothetical protein